MNVLRTIFAALARAFRAVLRPFAWFFTKFFPWIPKPSLTNRKGLFVLFMLVAGFGSVVTIGGTLLVHYTETASFCGRCHTMGPEMVAHELSPHSKVACAECHVEPGTAGFIKAKINGTKQLIQVMTGTFPQPIPAPDHGELPPVADTCLRCHSIADITKNGGPIKLVLRPNYQQDVANTREMVAVVLRPAGLGDIEDDTAKGVHWHIQQKVTYTSREQNGRTIDLIEIAEANGEVETFASAAAIGSSADVTQRITQIKAMDHSRTMDCLDCHNRTGHGAPSPDQAVDASLSEGKISTTLPFIKRDAVDLLARDYKSTSEAEAAIDTLRTSYRQHYPLVLQTQGPQVDAAIDELKRIYRLVATPDMKVHTETYPNDLGHQNSPGCFRCHDGAHFKVEKGKMTTEAIPSACSTCHTFPQVGGTVAHITLGGTPKDHTDRLFVFNHKNMTSSLDPTTTACGSCHEKQYCQDCHNSGAAKISHDEMLYNHAQVIRNVGGAACASCHQPAYCAGCHQGSVLTTKATGG